MSFWETMGGLKFVDQTIPMLGEQMEFLGKSINNLAEEKMNELNVRIQQLVEAQDVKKRQYCITLSLCDMEKVLEEELNAGSRYVQHIPLDENRYIFIFENDSKSYIPQKVAEYLYEFNDGDQILEDHYTYYKDYDRFRLVTVNGYDGRTKELTVTVEDVSSTMKTVREKIKNKTVNDRGGFRILKDFQ